MNAIYEYIDACKIIEENREEIRKLEGKKQVVHDRVSGSMTEFPYAMTHYNVEGSLYGIADDDEVKRRRRLLIEQVERAEKINAMAQTNTRSIQSKAKTSVQTDKDREEKLQKAVNNKNKEKEGSLASKANLVKKYNENN